VQRRINPKAALMPTEEERMVEMKHRSAARIVGRFFKGFQAYFKYQ